jgi:nitric oxide reductase large subunit
MNRTSRGSLAIIMGSLVLSLELYGLKIIQQGLEIQKGSWKTNAMHYAKEMPMSLAIWITIAVIIYGIILIVGPERIDKLFNE